MDRKAKIVATLGPSSNSRDVVVRLMKAGMNVARLNFSHGTHEEHANFIKILRNASSEMNHPLAILQDLQGPKIRVGKLIQPLELSPNSAVILYPQGDAAPEGSNPVIPVDFSELFDLVHGGERILIDDGRIELIVEQVEGRMVFAKVSNGGVLTSHKGFNLPGVALSIPGFTAKDKADLEFGLSQEIDMVAISFVRSSSDVDEVKNAMIGKTREGRTPLVIAKLERPEAVDNLQPILEAADGVMVARGDLGVEMPPERVPTIQKQIIMEANRKRKLVITATQMLDSMIANPLPTRAEASDVANAIFDGTDAVMLSGETASGSYPIESVSMMERIVLEAEKGFMDWGHFKLAESLTDDDAVAITRAAVELAHDLNVAAIAVFTKTGRTALLMSKMRPQVPIYAFTPVAKVHNHLAAMWGVVPVQVPLGKTLQEMINTASSYFVKNSIIARGKQIVVISGYPVETVRPPNMALLHTIGEKV